MNWELNTTNIIGASAMLVEILVSCYIAYRMAKRDKRKSHRICDEEAQDNKYNPSDSPSQPESPHSPVPHTMHDKTNYVACPNSNDYGYKVLHKCRSIICKQSTKSK